MNRFGQDIWYSSQTRAIHCIQMDKPALTWCGLPANMVRAVVDGHFTSCQQCTNLLLGPESKHSEYLALVGTQESSCPEYICRVD